MARKKRSERTVSRIGFTHWTVDQAVSSAKQMVKWNPTVDGEYGADWGGPIKALDLMDSIVTDVDTEKKEKIYNDAVDEINYFLDFLTKMIYYKESEYWGPYKPRRLSPVMAAIAYKEVDYVQDQIEESV